MPFISEFMQRTDGNKNPGCKFNLREIPADIPKRDLYAIRSAWFFQNERKDTLLGPFWFQETGLVLCK